MRNRFKIIGVLLSLFVLSLAFGFLIQAWTGPTSAPPGANLPRPINVGDDDQEKAGRISATEFYDVDDPDYYINPSGASKVSGSVSIGGNLVDLTNSKTIYDASTGKISPLVMPYKKGAITSDWATTEYTAGYYDVSNLSVGNVASGISFGRTQTGTQLRRAPMCASTITDFGTYVRIQMGSGTKARASHPEWNYACAAITGNPSSTLKGKELADTYYYAYRGDGYVPIAKPEGDCMSVAIVNKVAGCWDYYNSSTWFECWK